MIVPLLIIKDRYSGTYSGGQFVALNCDHYNAPQEITSGDVDEMNFWYEYKRGKGRYTQLKIAVGNTPEEAYKNLKELMNG